MAGRLSLNQATIKRATVKQAVDGCAKHGVPSIGLWREPVADAGIEQTRKLVRQAGLRVSSLCRGGFLTDPDNKNAIDDNKRAIDEAHTLGTDTLVMVVGGVPDRDLIGARQRVQDGIEVLTPYAQEAGVILALEPMHPIFCADRGVLSTLKQALDWAERFDAGVVVDAVHVWWDPELDAQIERAGRRIASYQVCDWLNPLPPDVLLGRALPGDGNIDLDRLTRHVAKTGYSKDVEVEIFNADLWAADPDEVIAEVVRRYHAFVEPAL
ncbi:3-dehydroshikimate dehydratase [Lentzea sp. NBRC 105346]|uniref:sugar phosphate isomerase/epimerase family protein n=1 Tax=Lentzea sp. NBRC 105346 TaxID=3032205 RepID=UPI0024A50EFE|nr:sugar phosphate isomerase/epimerase family protein [Lentzea sp. NBRC 105346]GLZ34721.1 3-dehydroshikimate dehydratase [Lentzea sp. NBRC 105346]